MPAAAAIAVPLAIGAAGTIANGIIGSNAARDASNAQIAAGDRAISGLNSSYNSAVSGYSPWVTAGSEAVTSLSNGIKSGSYNTPTGSFTPQGYDNPGNFSPTSFNFQADPGYQFTLGEGLKATSRQAAASGNYLGGGTSKALAKYATGFANQTYNDAFNRNQQENTFGANLWNQNRQFDYGVNQNANNFGYNQFVGNRSFTADQSNNAYNRVYSLAGLGFNAQQGAGQMTTELGRNVADITTGQGNASASGTMGVANAWSGAINNFSNNLQGASSNYLMSQALKK